MALLSFVEEARDFMSPGTFFTANFSNSNLAHADLRGIAVYGALTPKPKSLAPPSLAPMAWFTWARQNFPLPMDSFAVEDKPRETTIATLNGPKKVSYLFPWLAKSVVANWERSGEICREPQGHRRCVFKL
jgi:hypothetical protein